MASHNLFLTVILLLGFAHAVMGALVCYYQDDDSGMLSHGGAMCLWLYFLCK